MTREEALPIARRIAASTLRRSFPFTGDMARRIEDGLEDGCTSVQCALAGLMEANKPDEDERYREAWSQARRVYIDTPARGHGADHKAATAKLKELFVLREDVEGGDQ